LQQFDRVEALSPICLRPSDAEINWAQKQNMVANACLPENN
jgi:hypothetical protein